MTNYVMNDLRIPKKVLQTIERKQTSFWWGSNIEHFCQLIAWNNFCRSKSRGGLGIRNPILMNQALLSELAWRIMSKSDTLTPGF